MGELPVSNEAFLAWKKNKVTKLFFEALQLDIDSRVGVISERIRNGVVPDLEHQQRVAMCAELFERIKGMDYEQIQQIFEYSESLKQE